MDSTSPFSRRVSPHASMPLCRGRSSASAPPSVRVTNTDRACTSAASVDGTPACPSMPGRAAYHSGNASREGTSPADSACVAAAAAARPVSWDAGTRSTPPSRTRTVSWPWRRYTRPVSSAWRSGRVTGKGGDSSTPRALRARTATGLAASAAAPVTTTPTGCHTREGCQSHVDGSGSPAARACSARAAWSATAPRTAANQAGAESPAHTPVASAQGVARAASKLPATTATVCPTSMGSWARVSTAVWPSPPTLGTATSPCCPPPCTDSTVPCWGAFPGTAAKSAGVMSCVTCTWVPHTSAVRASRAKRVLTRLPGTRPPSACTPSTPHGTRRPTAPAAHASLPPPSLSCTDKINICPGVPGAGVGVAAAMAGPSRAALGRLPAQAPDDRSVMVLPHQSAVSSGTPEPSGMLCRAWLAVHALPATPATAGSFATWGVSTPLGSRTMTADSVASDTLTKGTHSPAARGETFLAVTRSTEPPLNFMSKSSDTSSPGCRSPQPTPSARDTGATSASGKPPCSPTRRTPAESGRRRITTPCASDTSCTDALNSSAGAGTACAARGEAAGSLGGSARSGTARGDPCPDPRPKPPSLPREWKEDPPPPAELPPARQFAGLKSGSRLSLSKRDLILSSAESALA